MTMDEFDNLEQRYGGAFVQGIRDYVARAEEKEIQFFELKQMNDSILPRYRLMARRLLRQYRTWKVQYDTETDELEKVYKAYEGIFLRRQLSDALHLYANANRDYHEMRRTYINRLFRFDRMTARAANAA